MIHLMKDPEIVKFAVELTIAVWALASIFFMAVAYTWWLEDLRKRKKEEK